jgi:ubiquinone/menaquinone biosynthesis C-methylase UbiE
MDHRDHVALLRPGIDQPGGTWADLGAGEGTFTLALAELLGPGATLYAVDRDARSLRRNRQQLELRFPATALQTVTADFTQLPDLPPMDGLVMANSLHFVRDKTPVVRAVRSLLKPGGTLLLVEYNVDQGNRWVPYPLSFPSWQRVATAAGFHTTTILATRPSRFLDEIYSARSL